MITMLRMLLTGVLAFLVVWFAFAVLAVVFGGGIGTTEAALMIVVGVVAAIWAARREARRPSI